MREVLRQCRPRMCCELATIPSSIHERQRPLSRCVGGVSPVADSLEHPPPFLVRFRPFVGGLARPVGSESAGLLPVAVNPSSSRIPPEGGDAALVSGLPLDLYRRTSSRLRSAGGASRWPSMPSFVRMIAPVVFYVQAAYGTTRGSLGTRSTTVAALRVTLAVVTTRAACGGGRTAINKPQGAASRCWREPAFSRPRDTVARHRRRVCSLPGDAVDRDASVLEELRRAVAPRATPARGEMRLRRAWSVSACSFRR